MHDANVGQRYASCSIPPDAIRKMIGSAMQIIVQCSRYHDGGRRTSHISETLVIFTKRI